MASAGTLHKEADIPRIDLAKIDNVPYYVESKNSFSFFVTFCKFNCLN